MITVESKDTSNLVENWLKKVSKINPETVLSTAGVTGTSQLRENTPRDRGITASAWRYEISKVPRGVELAFINDSAGGQTFNIVQGIRYGHGTGTGGYVPPNDFVTPIIEALVEGNINAFVRSVMK